MGDVAMLVPVLRAVLRQNQLRITLITRPQFAPIFSNIDGLSLKTLDLKNSHAGMMGLWRLSREVKSLKPDHFLDLHDVLRTKILKGFLKIQGIQYSTFSKGRAEKNKRVAQFEDAAPWLKSTHERYADAFSALGLKLELIPQERASLEQFAISSVVQSHLAELRPPQGRLIGLAPFAAYPGKTYPVESTRELCQKLVQQGHTVLLFGAPGAEQEGLESVASSCDGAHSVAGKWTFNQELELMSALDLMIAMDSSNGHLAANFGLPVLTLWGATHPSLGFAPYGQPRANQLCADRTVFPMIPTSVYGNKLPPGAAQVMHSISPERVLEKALKILD